MTSGIIEILVEDTGVQNMVGRNAADTKYKVYPVVAEQGEEQKYITVFKAQNDPVTSLTKDLASELDYPRVTVACWSVSFRESELMFEAVRLALDNQSMDTNAGYLFNRIWLVNDRDGFDVSARMYVHVAEFGVELRRLGGEIFQPVIDSGFVLWGGIWNWAANSNSPPSGPVGKVWITADQLGNPGDQHYYPADTMMVSKVDDAAAFEDFVFYLP